MMAEDNDAADHESAMDVAGSVEAVVAPAELTLLIVDDDKPFLSRLGRAMEARGFAVTVAESVARDWRRWKSRRPLSRLSTCGLATAMASTLSPS